MLRQVPYRFLIRNRLMLGGLTDGVIGDGWLGGGGLAGVGVGSGAATAHCMPMLSLDAVVGVSGAGVGGRAAASHIVLVGVGEGG